MMMIMIIIIHFLEFLPCPKNEQGRNSDKWKREQKSL